MYLASMMLFYGIAAVTKHYCQGLYWMLFAATGIILLVFV